MPNPEQLDTLLSAWQEARAAGRDPSPSELCHDCPDLAPRLAERIALLRQMSGLAKDAEETATNPNAWPAADAPMPKRIGKYHILTRLGQGGMGAVYWAEDDLLRRPTAIKVLRPDLAARPGAVKRFLQEARAAATVEHEAIVPIWHVDEDNGVPYLAMPKLRGESLADRLSRGRLLPTDVVRVAANVAAGLSAAHAAGLIHRDIKPANIWLEQKDETDKTSFTLARILDFGLARFENEDASRLTGTGDVLGTPAYMAPEQARGESVDARADLFSLGCVLYHAATGKTPFRASTVVGTLLAVAQEHPPSARSLVPELPGALNNLIVRLMEKDRDNRPGSAADVVQFLKKANEPDSTTLTIPSSAAPRRVKALLLKRRSRNCLWIGVGLAVVVLAVGIGTIVYSVSQRNQSESLSPSKPSLDPGVQPPSSAHEYGDLDRTKIPDEELYAQWQPAQLVAVVGGHAGLVGPLGDQTHATLSPDGKWIAWSSSTGVRIWDSEKLKLRFRQPSAAPAAPIFNSDSRIVATPIISPQKQMPGAQLHRLDEENPRFWRGIGLREGPLVTAIAMTRDARIFATGTATGEIRLWDSGDAAQTPPRLIVVPAQTDASHPVRQLIFCGYDKKLIALCHDDKPARSTVRAWSIAVPDRLDGKWTATPIGDTPAHADTRRVAVHPNGTKLFVPSPGKIESDLSYWEIGTPMEHKVTTKVPANCRTVDFLNASGKGEQSVRLWLGFDGPSALWSINTGKKKDYAFSFVSNFPPDMLAITPDQNKLLVLAGDGRLTVQNSAGKELTSGPVPLADADHPPVLVGNRLFTFVPVPEAWEIRGGRFVPIPFPGELKMALGPVIGSPAVTPSGNEFAWRVRGDVHVYRVSPAAVQLKDVLTTSSPVVAFAWGANDQTMRTAHRDGAVRAWNMTNVPATNKMIGTIPPVIRDKDFTLNASGTEALVTLPDRRIYRYSLTDPKTGPAEVVKDSGPRTWLSPTGSRLLADDAAGLNLLNAKTGQRIGTPLSMPSRPTAVQWAADDHHVLVTLDGLLYVLRFAD